MRPKFIFEKLETKPATLTGKKKTSIPTAWSSLDTPICRGGWIMAGYRHCHFHDESAFTCECNDLFVMMGMDKMTTDEVAHSSEAFYQKYHRLKGNHERRVALLDRIART